MSFTYDWCWQVRRERTKPVWLADKQAERERERAGGALVRPSVRPAHVITVDVCLPPQPASSSALTSSRQLTQTLSDDLDWWPVNFNSLSTTCVFRQPTPPPPPPSLSPFILPCPVGRFPSMRRGSCYGERRACVLTHQRRRRRRRLETRPDIKRGGRASELILSSVDWRVERGTADGRPAGRLVVNHSSNPVYVYDRRDNGPAGRREAGRDERPPCNGRERTGRKPRCLLIRRRAGARRPPAARWRASRGQTDEARPGAV